MRRVEEATTRMVDSQNDLQAQKRKNALLEKQLGKVKVEQQGQASKPGQFTPFCLLLTHPPLSSSFFLYLPALVTIH